jgi:DNA ligase D-like protein (predicted 3'-phosphoesterase)
MRKAVRRKDTLEKYREKRNFLGTPEPRGNRTKLRSAREPIFVIQKHWARSLHYDFRLEVDGVLKSWAVRKGPSTDPHQKRLAVATEDHPLDYAHFEGVIPPGHYGAGVVMVWDTGIYRNLTKDSSGEPIRMQKALEHGHVKVRLEGKKLKGGYALTRFREKGQWLLVKIDDEKADARRNLLESEPESALSGRTESEIAQAEGRR